MRRNEFRVDSPFVQKSGKALIFCLLLFIEILILASNWRSRNMGGIPAWYVLLPTVVVLSAENAVKMWGLRKFAHKIACYVFDTICLMLLTVFSDGTLISTLYIIILSEFYLSQRNLSGCIAMCVANIGLFLLMLFISGTLKREDVNIVTLISNAFNDIIVLVIHFLVFNFTLQIYRKNQEITQANKKLNENNDKLSLAYLELEEVTKLEERQRIAKDIHDTAGHSMTTVIMLTEAAKLIIDEDAAEAKRKIAAANLQAKNALEELRESVHLLSGNSEQLTLKQMLEDIIHDSTDGTQIVIRSSIADITLCDAKRRFVCNTLKEGISNGLRHGGATAFWFELKCENDTIEFLLSDNGKGMNIADLKEGFGLSGMHTRAGSLGGHVWFETEAEGGFEIHMRLPSDGGATGADHEN